ncbi:MAG: folate-binding protein [Pseudomonadota bacterium]|nr:folate-binding protein [Pseudomonadota bacterium]
MKFDRYADLADRAVIAVSGEEARPFLQGLITNNIDHATKQRAIYGALLTPQGKFLHDFFIVEHEGRILLDVEEPRMAETVTRLTKYRMRAKVDISDESGTWSIHALFPGGAKPGTVNSWNGGITFADPRHADLGHRAIMPTGTIASVSIHKTTLMEYERTRISLGIPDAAKDLIPEKSIPLECGFEELNAVDFDKGCYVGQEVTARMKHRNLIKKRLFPVDLGGAVPTGTAVTNGTVTAGEVRSNSGSKAIALLRLDLAETEGLTANGVSVAARKPEWAVF